jgi:hypothetical protein
MFEHGFSENSLSHGQGRGKENKENIYLYRAAYEVSISSLRAIPNFFRFLP